jgi:hypothetical protein
MIAFITFLHHSHAVETGTVGSLSFAHEESKVQNFPKLPQRMIIAIAK